MQAGLRHYGGASGAQRFLEALLEDALPPPLAALPRDLAELPPPAAPVPAAGSSGGRGNGGNFATRCCRA